MSLETNALELLGAAPSNRETRRQRDEVLLELFRPNNRYEGGYSNAPKPTSSINSESDPPPYALVDEPKKHLSNKGQRRRTTTRDELPPYSCSNLTEGELDLKGELVSPFKLSKDRNWEPIYVILRGTMLCIHRRAPHIITSEAQAGRLMRAYTLQNAEVGLADDCLRVELEPLTTKARMVLPKNRWEAYAANKSAWQKVKFYILRLRVEEEQILLSTHSKTKAMAWLEALCSAMDIAPDVDERTDPRCFTETRVRARARRSGRDLERNRRLIRQQERMFREHFPQFATVRPTPPPMPTTEETSADEERTSPAVQDANADANADEDEDEDDQQEDENDNEDAENETANAELQYPDWLISSTLSSRTPRTPIRENPFNLLPLHNSNPAQPPQPSTSDDIAARSTSRNPTPYFPLSLTPASPEDFDPETNKWHPKHAWTYRHDVLYRRKCLPVLVSNAPRASDIIVKDGKRFKINWEKEVLIPLDAPLDVGSEDSRDRKETSSGLLWGRRRPSPGPRRQTGSSNGASLEARVTTSSTSEGEERSSFEDRSQNVPALSQNTNSAEQAMRAARRLMGDMFRPKSNSNASNTTITSATINPPRIPPIPRQERLGRDSGDEQREILMRLRAI
ncbi:MAG: hypothetical protein M1820_004912 [Bogoriella megaspora]|nr:MAG: hypothetical protein M1820_004912 [Bogoriella megaspora]